MTILPPDPSTDALRQAIGKLRAEQAWSYDDLAERTGLSRRTLIEIEQGRSVATLNTLHAIAHAFGVPVAQLADTLCEGHPPPHPAP